MDEKLMFDGSKMASMVAEDIFNQVLGLIKTAQNGRKFQHLVKESIEAGWNSIGSFKVNEDVYARLVREMNAKNLLYTSWSIEGTNKICVFYNPEDTDEIKGIINSVKTRVGLEIDSKEELEAVLSIEKDPAKKTMLSAYGLDPVLAEKVMKTAEGLSNPIILVKEKEENGTYSLHARESDKKLLFNIINEAAVSLSGVEGKYEKGKIEFLLKEQEQVDYTVQRVSENKPIDKAFIFSASFPSQYIKVEDGHFEVHKGNKVKVYSRDTNPETYAEILKFKINRLEYPVHYDGQRVAELGGPTSNLVFEDIKNEKTKSLMTYVSGGDLKVDAPVVNFERQYDYWLLNKINHPTVLKPTELSIYMDSYTSEHFYKEKISKVAEKAKTQEEFIEKEAFIKKGLEGFKKEDFLKQYSEKVQSIEFKSQKIEISRDVLFPEREQSVDTSRQEKEESRGI